MNLDEQTSELNSYIESFVQIEWLSTAITIMVVLSITAVVAHLATKLLRRVLSHDNSPLPSSTIFINISRVTFWAIGFSVVLNSCFGVDVSAAITALGIGGIAISLGFQDTLSNLISGLQITITGLVHPGDNIEVGGECGIVRDVTWRHTTIVNSVGECVVVPNSVINKSALVKLRPMTVISVPFVATPGESAESLDEIARSMAEAADAAVGVLDKLEKPARVIFSEVTDYGFRGTLVFTITDAEKATEAKDLALRAIAPFVKA